MDIFQNSDGIAQAERSPSVQNSTHQAGSETPSPHSKFSEYEKAPRFRGRRFLLLMSFAAGVVTLLLTAMMFNIADDSPAQKLRRSRLITLFVIVFTAFYSPVSSSLVVRCLQLTRILLVGCWRYTVLILRE